MRAGFATMEITPRVGVEMYGFGPYLNRHSKAVYAPLEARTAVFEHGVRYTAVISCDLGDVSQNIWEKTTAMLREKSPEKEWDVVICASHTHSGPVTSDATSGWGTADYPYICLLPAKLCESALLAARNISDVTVSYGEAECRHMGLNRIWDKDAPPLEEVLKEDWEPEKPELTDTTCRVIRFDDTEGNLKGFMANFGCHPVVCCQENRWLHGDWPGVAVQKLMKENPGAVGMFIQGAHGDINSGCVHKPEKESLEALEIFAERFAQSVRNALKTAKPMSGDKVKSVFLPGVFSTGRIFDEKYLYELQKEFSACYNDPSRSDDEFDIRFNAVRLRGIDKMLKLLAAGKTDVEGIVTGLRIGDVRILAAPFEIMQRIGRDVAGACPHGTVWVVSLCNGSYGYAPDDSVADRIKREAGGYEAVDVPLINGQLPFSNIHQELKRYMLEAADLLES